MSIRWKIAATCLLIVFVPIYFLNKYAIDFFDRFNRRALEEQMIDYAYIAGEEYTYFIQRGAKVDPDWRAAFTRRLMRYGHEFQTRVRLLDDRGVVLFDSHAASSVGEDMSGLVEVRRALAGSYGSRCALTPERKFFYYFIALPIHIEDRLVAVAYVSRHTNPIIRAIKRMMASHQMAMTLSLVVASAVALLLAETLTLRLRRLTRAVQAFARGDAPLKTKIGGYDEIAALGRAFTDMAAEIEHKNAYNRDFLAATAHELKTPLTAIKGAVELLEQGAADNPEACGKFLYNIRFENERLIAMVDDLALLTRLDAEDTRGLKRDQDLGVCMREILDRLAPTFSAEHADLAVCIDVGTFPVRVIAERIEQVMANLLENAYRYTPLTGKVEVRVEAQDKNQVRVSVRDTGSGIRPANLARVFDRFFTTEPHGQVRDYGRGLGLAIAKAIVENHGGVIGVKSTWEEGSCFFFTLPLAGKT